MPQQLPHFKTLRDLYYQYIMPLQLRYHAIEQRGIKVDFEARKNLNVKKIQRKFTYRKSKPYGN